MNNASVWRGTVEETHFPCLEGDEHADVAIVGGGITGVTLAMLLAEAGKSVALLEARSIGHGSTGNATGNLYAVLAEGLAGIAERWGEAVLRAVVRSRGEAVEMAERTAARLGLDCAFERRPLYRYATTAAAAAAIEAEYRAAQRAGLSPRLEAGAPIAVPSHLALVLDNQAQLHPLAYVRGIARYIASARCRLYERSAVTQIDEAQRTVHTARGSVRAREIVLATHTPKGRYLVHAEMQPQREYGVAVRLGRGPCPQGIFWGEGDYRHSVRSLRTRVGDYLIAVGEAHRTGDHDAAAAQGRLEAFVRRHFDVAAVAFRWSAQGYLTADGLPYIGRSNASELFVATGFATNGLTYGTLAATLIADQILGRANRWAELYRAARIEPVKAANGTATEGLAVAKALATDYLGRPEPLQLAAIPPGSGAVVAVNGDRLAVYRDEWGALTAVSPVCTHMKCLVRWNDVEHSWDCPCHGSRFDVDGRVVEGPALAPLARKAIA